jgi:sugar/nucleoside kinase (ribokinase family)
MPAPSTGPIAVVGNANLDLVAGLMADWPERGTETFLDRADSRIGGSAANTALVLQRLGAPSGLIASAGDDLVGQMISAQFSGPLDRIAATPGPSSVTFGLLHPGSERTFFSTPGHLDRFDAATARAGLDGWPLDGALVLVSGSFALPRLRDDCAALLRDIRDSGARIAIDPGWPDGGWTDAARAQCCDWMAASDVILINDKEALGLGCVDDLWGNLKALAARLRPGATLVVKCGPEGALSLCDGVRHAASSPAAGIFDTIGAGDAFNAGYLAALQAGAAPEACLRTGCEIASQVIRCFPRETTPLELPLPAPMAKAMSR